MSSIIALPEVCDKRHVNMIFDIRDWHAYLIGQGRPVKIVRKVKLEDTRVRAWCC